MKKNQKIAVLFVCLGNICRSPAAEGTFQHRVDKKGFSHLFQIDSAGTGAYHVGESPHLEIRKAAQKFGIQLVHNARQFVSTDFRKFDCILAMDRSNQRDILRLAQTDADRAKVLLFRRFDPESPDGQNPPDVPDPYYEGGFDGVQEIMMRTTEVLLDWLLEPQAG